MNFFLKWATRSTFRPTADAAWAVSTPRARPLPRAAPTSRPRAGHDPRVAAVRRRRQPGGTSVAPVPLRVHLHPPHARSPSLLPLISPSSRQQQQSTRARIHHRDRARSPELSVPATSDHRHRLHLSPSIASLSRNLRLPQIPVIELSHYDGPHVPVIVIMTSDSRTYVPHNLKGLLSSEQDPITDVLQYYNSLYKIPLE
jgi:hypothetical protein